MRAWLGKQTSLRVSEARLVGNKGMARPFSPAVLRLKVGAHGLGCCSSWRAHACFACCYAPAVPAVTGCASWDASAAVTCHQDDSNRGMVNAEFLAHCKQGVRIVNVARGEACKRGRSTAVRHRRHCVLGTCACRGASTAMQCGMAAAGNEHAPAVFPVQVGYWIMMP